jgi:hypothetical protein
MILKIGYYLRDKEDKDMKWTELYKTEQELIDDMMLTLSDDRTAYYHQLVKGYQYIESFKKYYQNHGMLTDKQMTQLKRLAPEVYKNVHEVRKAR